MQFQNLVNASPIALAVHLLANLRRHRSSIPQTLPPGANSAQLLTSTRHGDAQNAGSFTEVCARYHQAINSPRRLVSGEPVSAILSHKI